MRTIPTGAVAFVGILFVALVATGGAVATDDTDQQLESCAAESPENYTAPEGGDAIGYADGYWYDQPIRIANGSDADNGTADDNASSDGGNASSDDGNASAGNETESEDGSNVTASDGAAETTTSGENDSNTTTGDESASDDGSANDDGTETRPLNVTDGLDDREIDAIVARTAARVETQRCLSFESVPEVRTINQSVLETRERARLQNRSAARQRFDRGRLSAAMLLGNRIDPADARAATLSGSSLGYYDPAADEIVLVATDGETRIDEPTLAHELVHALQDQQYDLETYDANRTDAALAETALIEGDASLVEHRYEQHCEADAWSTACLDAGIGDGSNSDYLALELFFFQPYNDGARYVERLHEEGGWDAVDARYADVPASSKGLLAPETAEGFEPANVSFETEVDPAWQRVAPENRSDHDVLGPGTIAAAMLAPTFDTDVDEIYGSQQVTNNVGERTLHPLYPYDYGVDAATGWEGGKLEVYRNASDDDNATAVRWRTEWESREDAETFRGRYVELLDVRGDAASGRYVDTYEFSGDANFDGTVSVRQNGTNVTVVHGPTFDVLRALDDRAAREEREGSASSVGGIHAARPSADDQPSRGSILGAVGLVVVGLGATSWLVVRRR